MGGRDQGALQSDAGRIGGSVLRAVDLEVLARNIAREFSVRAPHKHGKIESSWKVMSRKAGAALLESGLRSEFWWDAVGHWVWVSNHTGSGANALNPGKAPMWTIGGDELLTPRRKKYARLHFGQVCVRKILLRSPLYRRRRLNPDAQFSTFFEIRI